MYYWLLQNSVELWRQHYSGWVFSHINHSTIHPSNSLGQGLEGSPLHKPINSHVALWIAMFGYSWTPSLDNGLTGASWAGCTVCSSVMGIKKCVLLLSLLFVACCILPRTDAVHNPSYNQGRQNGKRSFTSVIYSSLNFKCNNYLWARNSAWFCILWACWWNALSAKTKYLIELSNH